MPRLQVDISPELHHQLKSQARDKGMLFRAFIVSLLERTAAPAKTKTVALAPLNVEVEGVIKHFNQTIGDHTSKTTQRKYAALLTSKYGVDQVWRAIDVAQAAIGVEYAPSIGSLKQLHDKWVSLKSFYQRTGRNQTKQAVKIR